MPCVFGLSDRTCRRKCYTQPNYMSITRTILRPVAWAAGSNARRQRRRFLSALANPAETQQMLLRQMLSEFADTDFGRDHNFSAISSYEEFTKAVPIRSYEDLSPYMDKILAGNKKALLPDDDKLLMFAMTSATTGKAKYIPVSQRFLRDIRSGWNVFGISALQDHSSAWLRHILQITSSVCEQLSPTSLPCGAISGLLAKTQKRIVRRMYPAPSGCPEIADAETRFYTLLRYAAVKDVAIITTANPSSTIKLIETGQSHTERLIRDIADGTFNPPGSLDGTAATFHPPKAMPALARRIDQAVARDGRLLPGHLWNLSFLANWTGGTLKLYLPRLRDLFGDVPIRDIGLVASEGRFSLPLVDNSPAGPAEITANFLEFIPADQRSSANPGVLRVDELQLGGEYFIIFSNRTGLWRYDLDDRIRVVDHMGPSPVIEFLSRGLH
ncbi:MAG TPA: GH3 auxin-responsive promoter family protein, partial [Phycisphaerae bacterium]|nr:GH3 auxin-responsive promoter family protein [Phycisphaerae bacterium]